MIPLLASGWEVKEDADISLFYGGKKIKVIALEKPFEHKTRKGEIMMYIAKLLYVPSKEIFWIVRHDFSDFVLWKDRIITIDNKYITDFFLYTDDVFSINNENDLLSKVEKKISRLEKDPIIGIRRFAFEHIFDMGWETIFKYSAMTSFVPKGFGILGF